MIYNFNLIFVQSRTTATSVFSEQTKKNINITYTRPYYV